MAGTELTSNINSIDFTTGDLQDVFDGLSLDIVEKFFEPTFNVFNNVNDKQEPLISVNRDVFDVFLSGVSNFVIHKLKN